MEKTDSKQKTNKKNYIIKPQATANSEYANQH